MCSRAGVVLYVNHAIVNMFGYANDEGNDFFFFVCDGDGDLITIRNDDDWLMFRCGVGVERERLFVFEKKRKKRGGEEEGEKEREEERGEKEREKGNV